MESASTLENIDLLRRERRIWSFKGPTGADERRSSLVAFITANFARATMLPATGNRPLGSSAWITRGNGSPQCKWNSNDHRQW